MQSSEQSVQILSISVHGDRALVTLPDGDVAIVSPGAPAVFESGVGWPAGTFVTVTPA